jgi:hypothetical protein
MKSNLQMAFASCAVALAAAWALGCEEVLEACAPCGLVSDGATTVSGDPRLDGVLEAVGLHAAWGARVEADYDAQLDALAHAVGYVHDEGANGVLSPSPDQAAQIASSVEGSLFSGAGVTTTIELSMPRCTVDSALALARQIVCEDAAGCYIDATCGAALGSCAGLCVGSCAIETADAGAADCAGACYAEVAAAGDACLDECIGTCELADAGACDGRCRGGCDGACSAYGSDGACDGACQGSCSGSCSSASPIPCPGRCEGSCRVAWDGATGCNGTCRGSCATGLCDGACLGQFRPEGCDQPSQCDGVLACQETGKDLAWAHMRCAPGAARVHVELGASFAGDAARIAALASTLERTLALLLRDYGQLSLLVDGNDAAGEAAAEDIAEAADEDARPYAVTDPTELLKAGVPAERASLPLFALRARTSALAGEVGGGGYKVAAGSMPCAAPAFEDALSIMDALIPIEARDTSASDPAAWPAPVVDRTRGLYRVLDGAAILLGLGAAAGK